MAESPQLPPEDEVRTRWGEFAWTADNTKKAKEIIGRYPAGRQASAVLPLLDLAQRQVGAETKTQGWLPVPVIEFVARALDMPYMRVFEVATFYTMFNLVPVGRWHVQVCGTTPCMLRGSDDAVHADRGRMSRRLRQRADGPDQRRQLRRSRLRQHDGDPAGAGGRRNAEAGAAGRSPDQCRRRRADQFEGHGRRKSRLSGRMGMSALVAIILGIIVLVVFIKLALGILGIVLGLAAAVIVYFVAEKFIGGPRAR
jgi:NADH:ubiquinone oxidoreductase subunit E